MKKNIVTFGEVMARLAPPGFQSFRQTFPGSLDVALSGAEANVDASSLCHSSPGDTNYTSRAEVEALMHGSGSGWVQR